MPVSCVVALKRMHETIHENSRKTTAEVEKKLEAIQKSTDESKAKIEAMKQNPPDPADLK